MSGMPFENYECAWYDGVYGYTHKYTFIVSLA